MRRGTGLILGIFVFVTIGQAVTPPPHWIAPVKPQQPSSGEIAESQPPSPAQEPQHEAPQSEQYLANDLPPALPPSPASYNTDTQRLFGFTEIPIDTSSAPSPEDTSLVKRSLPGSVATVAAVIDGDTIELTTGERVRYIGIDTPESTTRHECFGEEARAKNRALVEGKEVVLVADVENQDKYGRLLRYVYLDEQFINLSLVEQGFATALVIPPNNAHASTIATAMSSAQRERRGLWASCPIAAHQPPTNQTPYNYDPAVPQASTLDCPPEAPIKGNAQSMIYHNPGGKFYEKTKPEACFAHKEAAKAAGYRQSKQ